MEGSTAANRTSLAVFSKKRNKRSMVIQVIRLSQLELSPTRARLELHTINTPLTPKTTPAPAPSDPAVSRTQPPAPPTNLHDPRSPFRSPTALPQRSAPCASVNP